MRVFPKWNYGYIASELLGIADCVEAREHRSLDTLA